MSTSPQLSDRKRFPYFFRTVPSDVNQAHALIDILRHFNWTYVAVVYSDSEYGLHCYDSIRELAENGTICFTTPYRVIRYQFKGPDYEQIMRAISNKPEISVILLILEKENAGYLMDAAKNLDLGSRYVWLGTDGWTGRGSVVMGKEETLEGAIAIQPLVSSIEGFDEYFMSRTLEHSKVNPWFSEFWEHHFECTLNKTANSTSSKRVCEPEKERITSEKYTQQSFVHFVRDAAYAFAQALHDMHAELCAGVRGVCDKMQHVDGLKVFERLQNVTFKDEEENTFYFNDGDGPTRYTIVNFQQNRDNKSNYSWHKVGNYSAPNGSNGKLMLESNGSMRYRASTGFTYPPSRCASPCAPNQVKVRERDDTCCWNCKDCGPYQVKGDEFNCKDCPLGTLPDDINRSVCTPIPEKYIDYRNPLAIGALGVSGFGILVTLFVGLVFWNYNDTPIIKAAGRELSYILLSAILLSFSVTFFIVAEPNKFTCGVMRFFLGFCPTLCYASIATKTNRIARIFHQKSGPSVPKTKYISPTSQMIIVGLLTSVEVVINIVWIVSNPPTTTFTYPDRETKLKICEGVDSYRYMIGFIYPLILIGLCTIYAIQTRKCPEGFNETKYIAFTNYTIIIIWLAFVPLYLISSSSSVRVVTLAISLSLSGLVELGCLFFPKIYIVLFKPEKNTKEVVMAPNRGSFVTLSNSASHGNHGMYHNHTPQIHQTNGKCPKHFLHPEEIPISNGAYSDPPSC
ncbi:unnamed protein product [Orchesella dallaii]|uniref:G-protein coupled receptors family 3 profile domain-containing protein n=1 Tax=Orchesella dallaii TaxID=48710 RepID=A0ABP1RX86_9HEXA